MLRTHTLQGPLACAAPVGGARELVGRSGRKRKTGNAGREAPNAEGRLKLMHKNVVSLNKLTFTSCFCLEMLKNVRIHFSAEVRILECNSYFKIGNLGVLTLL